MLYMMGREYQQGLRLKQVEVVQVAAVQVAEVAAQGANRGDSGWCRRLQWLRAAAAMAGVAQGGGSGRLLENQARLGGKRMK